MDNTIDPRPGIGFIDRYMPGASKEERDAAYERLCNLVAVLVRINKRLASDEQERIGAEGVGEVESGGRSYLPDV